VILDLVIIGLAISLEPIPLTSFILVLASKGGTRKGAAFCAGWILSLAIVVSITLLATGNAPPKPKTAPSLAVLAVKLAIGVALVLIAVRQRRRMGRPKKPKKPPKWQATVDSMSPWYAMGLAALVQPWGLIAAGAAILVEARLDTWEEYLGIVLFCILATSVYLTVEIYAAFRPERTQAFLSSLRTWLNSHTDQLIIWISLIVGLWLIGNSLFLIVT
jgi:threonine/homoserine/homoserine lactone efflux protein